MPAKSDLRVRNVPPATKLAKVLMHVSTSCSPGDVVTGTVFDAPYVPDISLDDYLKRMQDYMGCSEEVFIIASVLLTRLETALGRTIVVPRTVHRLTLAAVVLAIKVQDDIHPHNTYFAEVGGIPCKEMNAIESGFVHCLKWKTFVTPEEYTHCLDSLTAIYGQLVSAPHSPAQPCPERRAVAPTQHQAGCRRPSQVSNSTCSSSSSAEVDCVADSNGSYTTAAWDDAPSSSDAYMFGIEHDSEIDQVLSSPVHQKHHPTHPSCGQAPQQRRCHGHAAHLYNAA